VPDAPTAERSRHDQWLLRRLQDGDMRAREELVERFMPLARKLARRYAGSSESFDDILQVACVGLLKAIDGFDMDRGIAFSSYAVPTIVGELKRHFRDRSWSVRPPRDLLERSLRVDRAAERLSEALHRAPTVTELAADLDLDDEQVLEALEARGAYRAASFDAPLDRGEDTATLADVVGHGENGFGAAEDRVYLRQLSRVLSARDREILRMRFDQDMTQAEIGAVLGVSQMQVSRLIRAALEKMRTAADHDAALQSLMQESPCRR